MDQPLSLSQNAFAKSLAEEVKIPFDSDENSEVSDTSSVFLSNEEDFDFDFEEEEKDEQPPRAQSNTLPWRQAFKFEQNWLHDNNTKPGRTNCKLNKESEPVEFFSLIFDDDLFRDIMKWTNQRAEEKIDKKKRAKTKKVRWKDLTLSEMKAFFATIYLMGIHRLPNRKMHWECKTQLFSTQGVKSLFSHDRFKDIFVCLCLRDPTQIEPENKLYKIEPFALSIITNSQYYYRPHQDLSIDESMIAFRGRIGFKVYEPRKPIKHGLKAYVLCDAHTGYALNWKLYTGRTNETVDDVVLKLVEGLEDEGYRIFMDSYYTTVKLFQDLKDLNFGACGTVVPERLHMSKQISSNIAGVGDHLIQYYKLDSDPSLLLSCWKDHRIVHILSNYHSIQEVDVERRLRKKDRMGMIKGETKSQNFNYKETLSIPQSIADYNAHMGGVDRFDQLASYYIPTLGSCRWYLKVMFHLCEMAMINSYILYKSTRQSAKARFLSHLDFRKEVILGLTREHRQSKHCLTSIETRRKYEPKVNQMDRIFSSTSQDVDLEESTQTTTQDTTQSLESSIMSNQNDFIIPVTRSEGINSYDQCVQPELPQSTDKGYYTRSKVNIKVNFGTEVNVQKPVTKKRKIAQFESNPCRLQKIYTNSLYVRNQRKSCIMCKWKMEKQKEKDEIERLNGLVLEPPIENRVSQTPFWCETCGVPVCVLRCYDDHIQQRLKQVKLNENH